MEIFFQFHFISFHEIFSKNLNIIKLLVYFLKMIFKKCPGVQKQEKELIFFNKVRIFCTLSKCPCLIDNAFTYLIYFFLGKSLKNT